MPTAAKHPILIVDDEPDVLLSLKALLRRDFELHTAESGEEALDILSQHPIHVIMTDQRMPGMTGVELMQQAKTEYPAAIRIVFTGYADTKAVVEAINSGGLFRYITKPWDPDQLIAVLREAAEKYVSDAEQLKLATDLKAFALDVIQLAESVAAESQDTDSVKGLIERGQTIASRLDGLF